VKATKTIELASNYNCGSNYQSLTPVLLETRTINSSVDRDLSNAGSIEYEVKK
jgi:hypothetical protein